VHDKLAKTFGPEGLCEQTSALRLEWNLFLVSIHPLDLSPSISDLHHCLSVTNLPFKPNAQGLRAWICHRHLGLFLRGPGLEY
jgi:hypothetical protein